MNVEVSLPLDNIPDRTITLPGSCNAIDKDKVSCLTHCASKFGGCSSASEPLKLTTELSSKVHDVHLPYASLCTGLSAVNDVDSHCHSVELTCTYFD